MSKKILYIHQHFCPPGGAGGTRSYEIAKALTSSGKSVTMICGVSDFSGFSVTGSGVNEEMVDGISVKIVPVKYSNKMPFRRRLFAFVRFALHASWMALTLEYDLIYVTSTPLSVGLSGIVAKVRFPQRMFIFEVRDRWPAAAVAIGALRNRAFIAMCVMFEKLCYRMSDACIGLSPGIVEGIRSAAPRGHRIELVTNGCDLELFDRYAKSPAADCSEKMRVIYVGACGLANDLDVLVDAAAAIERWGHVHVQIEIVGDGARLQSLKARAAQYRLRNLQFSGQLPKSEAARKLRAADVGVLTMRNVPEFHNGTSPNKFFDYIACGLPVINNYPGWVSALIERNECGVVVAPDSPDALARGIEWLANLGPAKRAQMGRNARSLAERQFARGKLTARVVRLCDELLERSGKVGA